MNESTRVLWTGINVLLTGLVVLGTTACQTTMLGDDRIVSQTAAVLGVPVSQLSISDRANDGATNTSYIAHDSKSGASYACVINGGGVLAMGMTNPPTCNKK
jgi:hypothetical protein